MGTFGAPLCNLTAQEYHAHHVHSDVSCGRRLAPGHRFVIEHELNLVVDLLSQLRFEELGDVGN